ncbi:DMT family transporter [Pantoea stewartii]|uniref:DMT family transporter n=1 Tax=Pantoea stewartii TaxID=66269 RepID=UPI00138FFBB9|nr:DMT family transporter [Pantoea stewartii]
MAVLWMLFACIYFSLMNATIKSLSIEVSFFEIIFFRCFINMLTVSVMMFYKGITFKPNEPLLHLKRASLGNSAMYCGFYSLMHLPVAMATTLSYTNPIFQGIIMVSTQKGRSSSRILASILLGFLGVVILLNPNYPVSSHIFIVAGILSGLLTALAYYNIGKLTLSGEPILRVVFWFSLPGAVIGLGVCLMSEISLPTLKQFIALIAVGGFGTLGQLAMTRAYSLGEATTVSVISYSTIIFTAFIGYYLFGEKISIIAAGGMLCIVASGILASIKKRSPSKINLTSMEEKNA